MTRTLCSRPWAAPMTVVGLVTLAGVCPAQVLETETARLRLKGAVQLGGNFEYQTSSEGRESAVPFIFEYGITDRLELVVEPVAGTRIRPKRGPQGYRGHGAIPRRPRGEKMARSRSGWRGEVPHTFRSK